MNTHREHDADALAPAAAHGHDGAVLRVGQAKGRGGRVDDLEASRAAHGQRLQGSHTAHSDGVREKAMARDAMEITWSL